MTDRLEFLEDRQRFIGSSDAAAVLGRSSWGKTAQDVFYEKVDPVRDTDDPHGPKARGRDMEDPIARLYAKMTGRKLRKTDSVSHPKYPYIGANPDRIICQIPDHPGVGYQEIKAPGWRTLAKIHKSGLPVDHLIQHQHQLLAGRKKWGVITLLDYERWTLINFEVTAHKPLHQQMTATYERFWAHVEAHEVPPPETAIEIPDGCWDWSSEFHIPEDPELLHQLGIMIGARELKKNAAKMEQMSRKTVETYMDEHAVLAIRVPGVGEVTWKPQEGNRNFSVASLRHARPLDREKVLEAATADSGYPEGYLPERIASGELDLDVDSLYKRGKDQRKFLPKPLVPEMVEDG